VIEHHLQKKILHTLVLHERARFADLKPHDMDSNMFTYHLQQLMKQQYVAKDEDGWYELTPSGKAEGVNITLPATTKWQQAHAILLLAVRDQSGAWLLRRRLAQPTYGLSGFIHGEPVASEAATETAAAILERRTGVAASFTPAGSGYIRIFQNGALESFTAFTLLAATIEQQEVKAQDETGENFWYEGSDFTAVDMLPSMANLVEQLESASGHFYADLRYDI